MISAFDLFKIGVGPSSSHTMGPMTAAARFTDRLASIGIFPSVHRISVHIYGSLASTGIGHATDRALLIGLCGRKPDEIESGEADQIVEIAMATGAITHTCGHSFSFEAARDFHWEPDECLPFHPNGLTFEAFDAQKKCLLSRSYYSIGGGFVLSEDETSRTTVSNQQFPFEYCSASKLLELAQSAGLALWELTLRNEDVLRPREDTLAGLDRLAATMDDCIEHGIAATGYLPGPLKVRRRASELQAKLADACRTGDLLDSVNLWAIAVNEENAAGGRVVTAPTNGAAGIIPSIIRYARQQHGANAEDIRRFLLTATAIGTLYKRNASISAAEVGCQGEVGVACSMAAAGLCEIMGGTPQQVENAAEIGMEHNLGLTCDPIGGLVQIPCIERNAMGATKAIAAARLAMQGDGSHCVSLDWVIDTMRRTGDDMKREYKETSTGGLATYRSEC